MDIFLHIGRIGGAIFIVFQQLILLDISFNMNESWVKKADTANAITPGSGKKWLISILVSCAILYIGSLAVIVVLFLYFSDCASTTAFNVVTLLFPIIITTVQMRGEEASLLTSAVITAYGTYLGFLAVTRNSSSQCNPYMRDQNSSGMALGIIMTIISLTWAGWSNTADKRLMTEK